MKIIVLGYHNVGCGCLEILAERKENILAVFTHRDDPDENVFFDSMAKVATSFDIPCYMPDNINSPEYVSLIKELSPDIIFSFYYRNLVSREILDIPRLGAINLHGSLLPKYRGRCPVNWVLVNGEKETGVTLHYMIEKPDEGDIIAQKRITISFNDTAYSLLKKIEKAAVVLLANTWPLIKEGKNDRIPQDPLSSSYFGGRKPDDGKIDWKSNNTKIYNLVRAVTHPWPGAFCFFRGQKLFIWECKPIDISGHNVPGNLISFDRDGIIVTTGNGALLLKKCQIEGNEGLDGYEFARMYSLSKGEMFT